MTTKFSLLRWKKTKRVGWNESVIRTIAIHVAFFECHFFFASNVFFPVSPTFTLSIFILSTFHDSLFAFYTSQSHLFSQDIDSGVAVYHVDCLLLYFNLLTAHTLSCSFCCLPCFSYAVCSSRSCLWGIIAELESLLVFLSVFDGGWDFYVGAASVFIVRCLDELCYSRIRWGVVCTSKRRSDLIVITDLKFDHSHQHLNENGAVGVKLWIGGRRIVFHS